MAIARPNSIWLGICGACIAATMLFFALSNAVAQGGILHAFGNRLVASALNKIDRIKSGDSSLADLQFGVYGGGSYALPSQVRLKQPNGTDMTMDNVGWNSGANKMPPYHGFRATWWSGKLPKFGSMFDLAYIKVIADRDTPTQQSGLRNGATVSSPEPLSKTFARLEFTNGLNIFTWNGVIRLPTLFDRVRPYFAIGVGLSVPHVEVRRANAAERTFEFQVAGLAVQVLGGLEWRVRDRFSTFAEYKLSYARNDTDLVDKGSLETNLWINQFVLGVSGHVRRP